MLINPVIEFINTQEVILIPHGVLHYFPMQICLDDNGKFLLEKYVIKYLPSASVIPFLRKRSSRRKGKLLAICNTSANASDQEPLKHAKKEVEDIRSVVRKSEALIDEDATKSNFLRSAAEHSSDQC